MKNKNSAKKKAVEKREYFRLPEEFKLTFRPLEFPLGKHPAKESKLKDVSGGGMLIESKEAYEMGTILQLEINLEGWYKHRSSFFKSTTEKANEPLTVIGEVVRIEKFDDNTYDIGIRFTNVYDDDHTSLIKYINSKK
jgi:c-di-GMP-binding flagellar brake protein YcgR